MSNISGNCVFLFYNTILQQKVNMHVGQYSIAGSIKGIEVSFGSHENQYNRFSCYICTLTCSSKSSNTAALSWSCFLMK